MAYYKKKEKGLSKAYLTLLQDIKSGIPKQAYLFYGEESYLREKALKDLRRRLIPSGMEEFNYHRLEGKDLKIQTLSEVLEAMPMMAERTMTVVTDYPIFDKQKPSAERDRMIELLQDIPEYSCLVFVYDTIEYGTNARLKKLTAAVKANVQTVEFCQADRVRLIKWVKRRFAALGKDIDTQTVEYLTFLCGELMTGLIPEIDKISTFAKGKSVTVQDIDAVADPILTAEVFKLSDAILSGKNAEAARRLSDLLKLQTQPLLILGVLGSQLRRLYTARLAIDSGKDNLWLMNLWGYKSDYPVKLLRTSAKKATSAWCENAVRKIQVLDRRLKSEKGVNGEDELKMLLVQLGEQTV